MNSFFLVRKQWEQYFARMDALSNKVIIMNGFSNEELVEVMRAVKALCKPGPQGEAPRLEVDPKDLIFAKTTPNSLEMVLKDLIEDMSEDHEYLKQNPPKLG